MADIFIMVCELILVSSDEYWTRIYRERIKLSIDVPMEQIGAKRGRLGRKPRIPNEIIIKDAKGSPKINQIISSVFIIVLCTLWF